MPNDPSKNRDTTFSNNNFVSLDELVYAPLHAVAHSNISLANHLIELIQKSGNIRKRDTEDITALDTLNVSYQQLRNDEDNTKSLDEIELKIPLLSLMPVTALQVSKTEIEFDTEVKAIQKDQGTGQYIIESRVCGKKNARNDTIPKIHFKIEAETVPAQESFLRLIDILNVSPVPTVLSSHKLDPSGVPIQGDNQTYYQKNKELQKKEHRLQKIIDRLCTHIEKKKNMFNDILRMQPGLDNVTYDLMPEPDFQQFALDHQFPPVLYEIYEDIQKSLKKLNEFNLALDHVLSEMTQLTIDYTEEAIGDEGTE